MLAYYKKSIKNNFSFITCKLSIIGGNLLP